MKRRVRQVCAWIAVFALLFTQLATAAYACPQLVEKAQAAQQSGDCEHLANSNLCESHCDYGSASFDTSALVSAASSSRDRGPWRLSWPYADVTSATNA